MTDDLEQLVRDGLRRRADDVDTTAPLVGRARRAVRRRRGTRAGLAAAVAVVVAVGGVAVLDRPDAAAPTPAPLGPTRVVDPTEPAVPTTWRTERWHDLAVDVPADWAYGSAPIRSGRLSVVCTDTPFDVPYVGRPIMTSDRCTRTAFLEPTTPYVWLGADVEPGTVRVGELVQETVAVAGTTLTVAGDDVLRRRVLASARAGGPCPSELRRPPTSPVPRSDTGSGLLVCAYRFEGGLLRLAGSEQRDRRVAARFVSAYDAAPTIGGRCLQQGDRFLVLQDGDRQWTVNVECGWMRALGKGDELRLATRASRRTWTSAMTANVFPGPMG